MTYMPHNSTHERAQAETLVSLLLADGCTVSVHDGEAWALRRSSDKAAILDAMGSTDADTLRWYRPNAETSTGSFWLVYGNGPGELIAYHTANGACEAIWRAWAAKHPNE